MAEVDALHASTPTEALAYFKAKGFALTPSVAWQDLWQEAHATAFTVARSAGFDILADIHGALEKALAQGQTLAQFKKDLTPTLQAKGWWGKQAVVDPATGKTELTQLGSPRRLRTIYDTNLRTARAAGRWSQVQRMKARRPYLRYVAIEDGRTRPEHRRWHGLVLPVDDPFWLTHYPPNGWGCRCYIQQLSERDLQRYGYAVSPSPEIETYAYTNRRTGEVVEVPKGIDPGWGYNVGVAASVPAQWGRYDAIPELGYEAAKVATEHPDFVAVVTGKKSGAVPVGYLDPEFAQKLGCPSTRKVELSSDTAEKQRAHHPELEPHEYGVLPSMFKKGIILQQDALKLAYYQEGDRWYKAIVKATRDGERLFLTSFTRLHRGAERKEVLREARRSELLRGTIPWNE